MNEFLFVLKCLAFTAVLVVFMQLKVSGATIEMYSYSWLKRSSVSQYMQSVAAGGILVIRNLGGTVKNGVAGATENFHTGSEEQARR